MLLVEISDLDDHWLVMHLEKLVSGSGLAK